MTNLRSFKLCSSLLAAVFVSWLFAMPPQANTGALTGSVTVGGTGISGALVRIYLISAQQARSVTATRTGAGGAFSFSGLTPGEYVIIVSQPPETLFQGRVMVEPGRSVSKDINLSGTIKDESRAAPIQINGPIALAYGEQFGLLGLTESGKVVKIDTAARTVRDLFQCVAPTDLNCARVGSRDLVVVTQRLNRGMAGRVLTVLRDGDSGPLTQTVLANGEFSGVAVDASASRVLLANAKANEIYSYQIVGNRLTQGSSLVSLPQSRGLASIALDADNKRLFVSDSQGSTIYAVDLQTRKSSVFAQGFSQVKALAVDARRGRLCIAAGHRVLALPLAGAAAPEVVREGLKLSSGIALDGNGRIWVSDFASGSVIGPI